MMFVIGGLPKNGYILSSRYSSSDGRRRGLSRNFLVTLLLVVVSVPDESKSEDTFGGTRMNDTLLSLCWDILLGEIDGEYDILLEKSNL